MDTKDIKKMTPLEKTQFTIKLQNQFKTETEAILPNINTASLDELKEAKKFLNEALEESHKTYPDIPRMDIFSIMFEITRRVNILDGSIKGV